MLAGELALAGIDVSVVERRANQAVAGSRAGGLLSRTLEVLDQRGIADRFVAEGQVSRNGVFAGVRLDIDDLPSRFNYTLGLWQTHVERILAGWIAELGVRIHYGAELTGFTQEETGVAAALSDGGSLRAQYLVGCDGGRSRVRKMAGIDFPGWDPTRTNLIAEVEMNVTPPFGVHRDAIGTHAFGREKYEIRNGEVVYADDGPVRVMVTEPQIGSSPAPTLEELRAALIAACGTDYGVHRPRWISRFSDMTRQAAAYRDKRVLLAGDAAHIHAPDGGQGLQTGMQDAVNLGWKLGQVVKGISSEGLLDSYHAERHPVAATVLRNTMAAVALRRADERTQALRETLSELLGLEAPRRLLAATMAGLDIRYELGHGHALLGRRMPDLDVVTADGATRVLVLLHAARPLLLNFGAPEAVSIAPWADRVQRIDARCGDVWELPVLGAVRAPAAVLIRPDGYVAWAGGGHEGAAGLADALTRWFGAPAR
jgi:2-polyprenyl-6-methoxyphenol hydroxylase-like FAD-dependent oxidoreductase